MTHDLKVTFNVIVPFGEEDAAKERQNHARENSGHVGRCN